MLLVLVQRIPLIRSIPVPVVLFQVMANVLLTIHALLDEYPIQDEVVDPLQTWLRAVTAVPLAAGMLYSYQPDL